MRISRSSKWGLAPSHVLESNTRDVFRKYSIEAMEDTRGKNIDIHCFSHMKARLLIAYIPVLENASSFSFYDW